MTKQIMNLSNPRREQERRMQTRFINLLKAELLREVADVLRSYDFSKADDPMELAAEWLEERALEIMQTAEYAKIRDARLVP